MKKQVITRRELNAKKILEEVLPEYIILANVRLADVIELKSEELKYAKNYHLDFVICDQQGYRIAAVELDDSTHDTKDGIRRDQQKNKWMAQANVKLIRIRQPEEARQIRARIEHYTPPKSPSPVFFSDGYKKFISGMATVVLLVIFMPKITSKMNSEMTKSLTPKAMPKTAVTSSGVVPGQVPTHAPVASQVLVRGKTLRECAPDNQINEAVLRCTKDHYEPQSNGH